MTASVRLNPDLLEEDFATWVIDTALTYGWMVVHFRSARTAKGFRTPVQGHRGSPDLLLARNGDVLLAELKSRRGQLSAEQKVWLRHLGPLAVVWRPRDAAAIVARLARPKTGPESPLSRSSHLGIPETACEAGSDEVRGPRGPVSNERTDR